MIVARAVCLYETFEYSPEIQLHWKCVCNWSYDVFIFISDHFQRLNFEFTAPHIPDLFQLISASVIIRGHTNRT